MKTLSLLKKIFLLAVLTLSSCTFQPDPSKQKNNEQSATEKTEKDESMEENSALPQDEQTSVSPSDDDISSSDDENEQTSVYPEPAPEPVEKNWTLLVYMAADNNLEKSAVADFNEMENADFSDSDISVLVLFDRSPGYDATNGDWTDTRLFTIGHDREKSNAIVSRRLSCPELGLRADSATELDMADKATLSAFMGFASREYPARHYGLIVWGHGTGWRADCTDDKESQNPFRAYAIDSSAGTYMTISALREGIQDGLSLMQREAPLDFIGFDTCFGLCMETAYELRDCAEFLAGTPALVPASGWQYAALLSSLATSDQSVLALCGCALEQYKSQYASYGHASFSVVDCAHVENAVLSFNQFAASCAEKITDMQTRTEWRALLQNEVESYHMDSYPCDYFLDVASMASVVSAYEGSLSSCAEAFSDSLRCAVPLSWNAAADGSELPLGVFYAVYAAEGNPQVSHPASYVFGSGSANQSEFVRRCTGYVPTALRSESLLDALFRKSFFAEE